MAGGAPLAPPDPPSSAGSQPPTPAPAVKGRPTAERGHKGRPRRRSAGDLRGRAVFRNDPLRAGDGVTPTYEGVKRGPKTVLPRWSPSHRAPNGVGVAAHPRKPTSPPRPRCQRAETK